MAGVRFLLTVRQQAHNAGADLVVHHPHRAVRRVLELTGTLPVLCPHTAAGSARPPSPAPAVVCALEEALTQEIEAAGADVGNAQLVDPATGALRIVAQHGFGRPFLDFFETVHDQESACGAALAAGRPVWVPDIASSPIFAATPALDAMLNAGAPMPVHDSNDRLAGMISVHYRQPPGTSSNNARWQR